MSSNRELIAQHSDNEPEALRAADSAAAKIARDGDGPADAAVPAGSVQTITYSAVFALAVAGSVMGIGVAGPEIRGVLSAARRPPAVMFNHGLEPAEVEAPASWTNESCAKCHQEEFDQWAASRHAVAASNHHFEVELLDPGNRQVYCLNCHSPRVPSKGLLPTQEPPDLDTLYQARPEWLEAGVDCLTCHVREGEILATNVTDEGMAAHPLRHAPELGRAEFCAGCHQFSMKDNYFPDSFRGHFQQASLDEFLRFRAAGNDVLRCHECHMPDGDHLMPGGYTEEMLKSAVDLSLQLRVFPRQQLVEVDVELLGGYVGHQIPGGEAFRFFSLHTVLEDAEGRPVAGPADEERKRRLTTGGKRYVTRWPQKEELVRPQGAYEIGNMSAEPRPDTRLFPDEIRRYEYVTRVDARRFQQPIRARAALVYHLMDSNKARQFRHAPEDVMWIVHEAQETIDLSGPGEASGGGREFPGGANDAP